MSPSADTSLEPPPVGAGSSATRLAERFQQACRYEPGNLVRLKTEKPRRLGCVEPGGNELPTEKFGSQNQSAPRI